jgi:hypothetical protein
MKIVAPLNNNEKKIPQLSSTMLVNSFEKSYGTFGKEKRTHYHQ